MTTLYYAPNYFFCRVSLIKFVMCVAHNTFLPYKHCDFYYPILHSTVIFRNTYVVLKHNYL